MSLLFDGFWTRRILLSGIRLSWMFWAIRLKAGRQLRPTANISPPYLQADNGWAVEDRLLASKRYLRWSKIHGSLMGSDTSRRNGSTTRPENRERVRTVLQPSPGREWVLLIPQ